MQDGGTCHIVFLCNTAGWFQKIDVKRSHIDVKKNHKILPEVFFKIFSLRSCFPVLLLISYLITKEPEPT